jgi:hypothetical protein
VIRFLDESPSKLVVFNTTGRIFFDSETFLNLRPHGARGWGAWTSGHLPRTFDGRTLAVLNIEPRVPRNGVAPLHSLPSNRLVCWEHSRK